ncbi:amidohydrolase family protein [Pusillimonas sp. MFBS29]|uniref:metal-dependent hydrolase family protein n=1 Tax=Pusillimonas sp. MFBS29 TaxID=2886690 RepID=UPI001D10FFDC|nr:amidohydrolase family protein [Pusillimonas sp. MFBS29]MCC2596309.1 amidohydrolase family protein [Pusillimonas sp. MFBS29]
MPEATTIAFKHCTILHPETGSLEAGKCIVVENGRISAIADDSAAPEKAIDAKGLTVMPGMIDCHVHVIASDMDLGRNALLPNVLASFRSIPILRRMIERGFTTVRDAGGADYSLAQATETGLITGPRIFPSGRALSQTGGHGDFRARNDIIEPCACSQKVGAIARVVDGVDNVRRAVREEIQKGATQIKIMASGGVASPNDPIHFLGYSEDEIIAIVEEASNAGTYVMAHAYTPQAIQRAIKCGVRTIEHGNLLDEATARIMVEHGAFLVPTTVTYDALFNDGPRFGFPPALMPKIEAVRSAGIRALSIAHEAGVEMAFGSDLLGKTHDQQANEFKIRADILGNLEAIRSATTVAAKVLQREQELGVVKEGAYADLLFIDGNPLDDISVLLNQGSKLKAIMKNGEWVKNELENQPAQDSATRA